METQTSEYEIPRVQLDDGKECRIISEACAIELAKKYITTYLVRDAFMAGITVETPEGKMTLLNPQAFF